MSKHKEGTKKEHQKPKKQELLSKQAIKRLPYYLKCLKRLSAQGVPYVSATAVARELGLYEVQVRKEFAAVSSQEGKPGIGFSVPILIKDIEDCLGYTNENKAVVVGAGHLGQALLSYQGFSDYGVELVLGFDTCPSKIGTTVNEKQILSLEELPALCQRLHVGIGIITVPAAAAQQVCDMLIDSGVKAIWNFAPTRLTVPDGIFLQYENMVSSLAMLSNHLQEEKRNSQEGFDI